MNTITTRWLFIAGAVWTALVCRSVHATCITNGYALNQSYTTQCAEVDNINIPLLFTNVTAYRITAMHPSYYPTTIYDGGPDFSNCTFGDDLIWIIGTNDGSDAELRQSGFVSPDEYFALDNPPEGTDEVWALFPKEINNDWFNDQYIRFSANEAGDANTELTIGANLTVAFHAMAPTCRLQIVVETWNGTNFVSRGAQTFTPTNLTRTWSIPDFTWLAGTDVNNIHLHVITTTGGVTTASAWGQYDYVELRKRGTTGETVTSLYDDGTTVVHSVNIDFWWRAPQHMSVGVIGGLTNNNAHYMRIARLTPTNASWNQCFILYEDGNARIIPLPPNGLYLGHFGASVILGPSADSVRPYSGIDNVTVNPRDLSLDITYENGATAHVETWSDRERTVVDVSDITYDTTTQSFARLRSMYVDDGKSDVDRIENADGIYPVMNHWTALGGTWWRLFHAVPSYHNTYAPDYEIEVLGPSQSFFTRQAESFDAASNQTVVARTNAAGGSALSISAAGGEAVYNIALNELHPNTELLLRYADIDGGDNGNNPGNLIDAYVDGVWKDDTTSMNTGGTNSFEFAPGLQLGDLSPGSHTIRLAIGPQAQGVDLDQFELISRPTGYWVTNTIFSRECETLDAGTGTSVTNRPHASGGTSVVMSANGSTSIFNNVFIAAPYSNVYARVRYADDWAPNRVDVIVDSALAGKFPSLTSQPLWLQNQTFEIGPAGGTLAPGWWRYGDSGQESWAAELGSNGVAFYPWGVNHYGGFGQDMPVTNSLGNVYTFAISGQFEPQFTSTTAETWMKMEFWVAGEPTNRYAVTNSVYATLKAAPNTWKRLSLTVTNNDAAVNLVKPIVGFGNTIDAGGSQAAKWDNAVLVQSSGTLFDSFAYSPGIYIGSLSTGNHTLAFTTSAETEGIHLDRFELFTVSRANRAPGIGVPAPITVPVGSSTNFSVTVSEYDPDCVDLSNTAAPSGSTFVASTFTWTPGANAAGTTSTVSFTANDQRGDTNSVVTSNVTVVVPFDWDGDGMGDGWEWSSFSTLTNQPDGDPDGDGIPNMNEYISGTVPTNGSSFFKVMNQAGTGSRQIVVPTQPARKYTIYFADGTYSNGMSWARFANTNIGVGAWIETNTAATTYTFVDDLGPATTGGDSPSGARSYQVRVELP